MEHSQEEIIYALQVIQDTCKAQQEFDPCGNCPLSKNGDCVLQNSFPEDWKLRKSPQVWKAFEE